MNRPGQEGGCGAGSILPDVLGLRHADGTPLTRQECETWAARLTSQADVLARELEGLLAAGPALGEDIILAAELRHDLKVCRACRAVWLAAVDVFKAVES